MRRPGRVRPVRTDESISPSRNTRMNRSIVAVLGLVALTTGVVAGQNPRVVPSADNDRAVKMLAPSLNTLVVGDTVNATWLPDGRFWYARTTLTGSENVVLDAVKSTREVVQTPPEGGQASPDAGGRGGRGGGGGRGGRGGGGGPALSRTCGPNVTGMTGPPPPPMSPAGEKEDFISRADLWVEKGA